MKIVIIEDEGLLVLDLQRMLATLGHDVVASAATLQDGLATIEEDTFDLAIIDLDLAGESSEPLARRLVALDRPFILATGYDSRSIDPELAQHPLLTKPYHVDDLKRALAMAKKDAG
jgi:two-component SAPR family response regulator